jgi:DNA-binding MarR family transcriptional regulator
VPSSRPAPTQLQFAAAIRVRITAKGRRRYEAAAADIRAMEEELLSSLTPAEREALLSALPKLAARR